MWFGRRQRLEGGAHRLPGQLEPVEVAHRRHHVGGVGPLGAPGAEQPLFSQFFQEHARLGRRAATAFVATPARRHTCRSQLSETQLGSYLNAAGLFGMDAGHLAAAQDYLRAAADIRRARGARRNLVRVLGNLSECHLWLGHSEQARTAAEEAAGLAGTADGAEELLDSHALLGAALDLAGDTAAAEAAFTTAGLIQVTGDREGEHLYSLRGIW